MQFALLHVSLLVNHQSSLICTPSCIHVQPFKTQVAPLPSPSIHTIQLGSRLTGDFSSVVAPNTQLLKVGRIGNRQSLFVREVKKAYEAVAGTDIRHLLLRIYFAKIVDHICEFQFVLWSRFGILRC